ncbi:MAG: hypothetical protein IKR68_05895 [Lachnospiraceae bacterium]|nr:hypothetical protein [Lachnospiraceae bacterium]
MRHDPEKNTQPKVRLLKVLLNFILSAAMVLGTIPCEPFLMTANAETEKTISGLGTAGILSRHMESLGSEDDWNGSYVYFGKYNNQPVRYRVLSALDKELLLDCDTVLFTDTFSDTVSENNWENSTLRAKLNGEGFYDAPGVFTDAEKAVIKDYYPADGDEGIIPSDYNTVTVPVGDRIFLLDVKQATCQKYGYLKAEGNAYSRSKMDIYGNESTWWLRSGSKLKQSINEEEVACAGAVRKEGDMFAAAVTEDHGVSPAFNLKKQAVIFSSLIGGDDGRPGSEYKLTVKDDGLSVSPAVIEKDNDNKFTVAYSITDESESADPTQISVLVTKNYTWNNDWGWDSNKSYLQYTKLDIEEFGQSGTGTFTLDPSIEGTWGKDYHVYILAEDVNDTYETDYASAPVEVKVNMVEALAKDVECTYDGKPHGIHVELNGIVDGVTVKYGLSANSCTYDESPTITSASESPKKIYYKASRDGYLTASGSATVKIDKAKLVVSGLNTSIKYGDPPTSNGVKYGGKYSFVNGEDESVLGGKLEYDYTYTRYDAPGSYRITPKGLTSYNYDIQYTRGMLYVEMGDPKTVSGNAIYGHSGTVELKDLLMPRCVLNAGSLAGVYDPDEVLDGQPSLSENVLSYKFKNDPQNVGKKARVVIYVKHSDGGGRVYSINVDLEVTACGHSEKTLVEGTSRAATCKQEGYEGDYKCSDCGVVFEGQNIPIDKDNHDFDMENGVVTKEPTALTKGEHTYTCRRCGAQKVIADIPCSEEGGVDPSNTEVDPREADLREELEGLGSDVPLKVDQKKDEDGNVVEETVTIGGREVSKVVTDPESGKETVVSKVWISGLEDSYTYTGAAIRPSFNVYDGLRKLTEKTDYTVSWKKNKDAGTGTATVKFKGNYKDSKSETVSFKIDPAVLGKDIIAHEIGVAAKSKGSVKVSPVLTWAGTGKSVSSKYFEITPSTVTGEGTTEAIINVKNGQKNFTGTATVLVKAVGDKNKLLSSAKVKFDPKSYSYSGMPIEPKYSLSIGAKTLTEGTDYRRVGITGNTNPGTATVIFEAVSGNAAGYVGSKTATFKISGKKELKEGASFTFICPDSVPYAKGGAKALVTVSDNDIHTILREGKDYTLSYSKNKSVTGGSKTAEVKVKGKGDYKGTVTLRYAIDRQSLSANGIVISAEDQFATKDKLKAPKITITDVDGKKLAANKDYTVGTPDTSDPANTDTKGIVSVTVTGKGAYEAETLTVTYRYEDKTLNIGKAKIAKKIDDQPFTGNAVKLSKSDLTGVLSANGRTLVPGSDFTVTGYTNNIKKGTAKVTVKGIGEFAGTKTLSFKIVQRSVDYSGAIKGGAKTAASLPGGF